MADIAIVRVDSRLIHGQVLSSWVRAVNANRIIIVDDDLAKDPFIVSIYKMSTPPGTTLDILETREAAEHYTNDSFGEGVIIVLFKTLSQVQRAYKAGFRFNELQLAGMGSGPERKLVFRTVSVSDKGAKTLKQLHEDGVWIYFQSLPEEPRVDAMPSLEEKFTEVFQF